MVEQIVSKYLAKLSIPVSQNYCEELIASHPYYFAYGRYLPSQYRIKDMMRVAPLLADYVVERAARPLQQSKQLTNATDNGGSE